ncbi:hypothetical protein A0256_01025 [Mucilaginibacter sp. PAMC 26640]|nr:hypothetical protein A0256_01025 [Mucilaginibacter sp. PAMC 26640]
MDQHHGQIVEYVVRKNGYSITDLATQLNVKRRSIYNYFQTPNLKYDIIYKIGLIVRHDFSKEFPHLFTTDQFDLKKNRRDQNFKSLSEEKSGSDFWKDKYIKLLEVYNGELRVRMINKIGNLEISASK